MRELLLDPFIFRPPLYKEVPKYELKFSATILTMFNPLHTLRGEVKGRGVELPGNYGNGGFESHNNSKF